MQCIDCGLSRQNDINQQIKHECQAKKLDIFFELMQNYFVMKEIEEFVKYSNLFETYKPLFSGKQRLYLEAFLEEDNSFTEIANAMNVSRQAVFDNIRRACQKLDFYEKNLKILENREKTLDILRKIYFNFDKKYLKELIQELEGNSDV